MQHLGIEAGILIRFNANQENGFTVEMRMLIEFD